MRKLLATQPTEVCRVAKGVWRRTRSHERLGRGLHHREVWARLSDGRSTKFHPLIPASNGPKRPCSRLSRCSIGTELRRGVPKVRSH